MHSNGRRQDRGYGLQVHNRVSICSRAGRGHRAVRAHARATRLTCPPHPSPRIDESVRQRCPFHFAEGEGNASSSRAARTHVEPSSVPRVRTAPGQQSSLMSVAGRYNSRDHVRRAVPPSTWYAGRGTPERIKGAAGSFVVATSRDPLGLFPCDCARVRSRCSPFFRLIPREVARPPSRGRRGMTSSLYTMPTAADKRTSFAVPPDIGPYPT